MTTMTFKTKLVLCFVTVIMIALSIPAYVGWNKIADTAFDEAQHTAINQAHFAAQIIAAHRERPDMTLWKTIAILGESFGSRLTYITPKGVVLLDSRVTQAEHDFDLHNDRPEVIQALAEGIGICTRFSPTLGTQFIYVAKRIDSFTKDTIGIIRVAVPLETILDGIAQKRYAWCMLLSVAFGMALFFAWLLSRGLDRSLNDMVKVIEQLSAQASEGGFRRSRLRSLPGRDFGGLAQAVNTMADNVDAYLHTISQQETQLRTILYAMSDGVLVLGPQGRITLANPRLATFFPDADNAVGKLPAEIIEVPKVLDALDKATKEGESASFDCELRRDTVVRVHIVRTESNDATMKNSFFAVAVFHDVSDFSRALTIRKEFVANVSHDLRTPLTSITGYAETLEQGLAEGNADCFAYARFAGIIRRNAIQMHTMVEELLELSRLENRTDSLEFEAIQVTTLLQEARELCRPQIEKHGLELCLTASEDDWILGDYSLLLRVFRNLADNAARFAPENSVVRFIAQKDCEQDTPFVRFSVLDDGPGLAAKDVPRVFERFYRAEKDRSRIDGATTSMGLGLAICKHIIERHAGHMEAEKGPGGVFHFTVPAYVAKEQQKQGLCKNRHICIESL